MTFITIDTEQEIFNNLMARNVKFTVECIDFVEPVITGTEKGRERKCRARAKMLNELLKDC